MGINNAENGVQNSIVNDITELKRNFNDLKTRPQQIGNGSMSFASFSSYTLGPFTLAAGAQINVTVTYMNSTLPFTYNGYTAINRVTVLDPLVTFYVDSHDAAHAWPYGASLTAGQAKMVPFGPFSDYLNSGTTDTNGQRFICIGLFNNDLTNTHTYWIDGSAIIPRPAIKPV